MFASLRGSYSRVVVKLWISCLPLLPAHAQTPSPPCYFGECDPGPNQNERNPNGFHGWNFGSSINILARSQPIENIAGEWRVKGKMTLLGRPQDVRFGTEDGIHLSSITLISLWETTGNDCSGFLKQQIAVFEKRLAKTLSSGTSRFVGQLDDGKIIDLSTKMNEYRRWLKPEAAARAKDYCEIWTKFMPSSAYGF